MQDPALATRPTTPGERIVAIDLLRGFALLGILVMNIRAFAMVEAVYYDPEAAGPMPALDHAAWWAGEALASHKFMSIFSMLFGAGVVLMYQRRDHAGLRSAGLHYRRMAGLLLIGFFHAYAWWYGDILVSYALCGLALFLVRKRGPALLIVLAVLFMAVGTLLQAGLGWAIGQLPADARADLASDFEPTQAEISAEIDAYRGGWWSQMPYRAATSFYMQTFAFFFWTLWRSGAMMLLGMALMKLGVLTGRAPDRAYWALVLAGLLIGLPLTVAGLVLYPANTRGSIDFVFLGSLYNYWGSAFLALGYVAGVMLLCRHTVFARFAALAAVGRMSLTNYLAQTVVCTLVFYGTLSPSPLFGRVGMAGQLGFVAGVWALQLIASAWWIKRYRSGPMEAFWRRISYGKRRLVQSGAKPIGGGTRSTRR